MVQTKRNEECLPDRCEDCLIMDDEDAHKADIHSLKLKYKRLKKKYKKLKKCRK